MAPRWVVASGVGLAQMLAFGTSLYLLTVLGRPIHEDTGWPLPWVVGGMSAGLLAGAGVAPAVGRWIRRRGGRPALSLSSVLFAAGLGLIAVSPNLAVYFAGWGVMGLAMAAGLYDVAFGALGRLYGLEARRAITTVTLWGGLASTVFWSLSGILVTAVGWRWTCGTYALMHLCLALPIYRLILPAAEPHDPAQSPAAATPGALTPRARFAVGMLAAVLMLETLVVSIVSVHLISLLQDRGLSLAAAIALGAMIGPTQVSARFGESLFAARFHPSLTLVVAVGGIAVGVALLSILPPGAAVVALMTYGAGLGLITIARGSLPLYLFGPLEAPVITGRLARPIAVVQALAPSLGAVLITRAGGDATLWTLAVCAAASLVAALLLRRLAGRLGQGA